MFRTNQGAFEIDCLMHYLKIAGCNGLYPFQSLFGLFWKFVLGKTSFQTVKIVSARGHYALHLNCKKAAPWNPGYDRYGGSANL